MSEKHWPWPHRYSLPWRSPPRLGGGAVDERSVAMLLASFRFLPGVSVGTDDGLSPRPLRRDGHPQPLVIPHLMTSKVIKRTKIKATQPHRSSVASCHPAQSRAGWSSLRALGSGGTGTMSPPWRSNYHEIEFRHFAARSVRNVCFQELVNVTSPDPVMPFYMFGGISRCLDLPQFTAAEGDL